MAHLFVSTLPLLIYSVMPTLSEEKQWQMMIMETLRKLILTTQHITIGSSHDMNKSPFLFSSYHFHIFSSALKASLALTQVGFVYLKVCGYR